MDSESAIREAYHGSRLEQRVFESKIGCIVALVLVPAGITLDLIVYPEQFSVFLLLRLLCDGVVGLILAMHFTRWGRANVEILTFTWLMSVQGMICLMIFLTEGFQSTYYAGLNLPMLAVGILLPTSVAEAALFCGATVGLYLATGLARMSTADLTISYNNLYFLLLTGVISVTAVYFSTRQRFAQFRLSYELDQRNQELARLDRLKSEFFANVSHELRTPLTLILAPVEDLLQRRAELPEALAERLEIIRGNALRLLSLVNDLLEVIRLEEGRVQLERRPLELTALLHGVVDEMQHLAESRGLTVTESLHRDAVWLNGDPRALEKIFFNLLSNAAKFTAKGGNIHVASRRERHGIVVTISDNGVGISSDALPFIFDRFRQADSSATRKYQGTGLGLALVKELSEGHDGEVGIDSRPGEGTTVTVRLPILDASSAREAEAAAAQADDTASISSELDASAQRSTIRPLEEPATAPEAAPAGAAGDDAATVLVVDDENDMRRYLGDLLRREYRVVQAADGQQGIDMAARHRPELMVLDLMLPEVDGLEVCRRLKEDPQTRGIRIILLTARADETSKLTALDNGADDFLSKPFSGVEVQTRLRNLLRSARLEQDIQRRNQELENALSDLRDTQGRLIQSEKLNALGRLSAGLLHEINNPLNYTLTALDVARNDPTIEGDSELTDILGDVDEGMQRIKSIVTELRTFAYPSKGDHQELELRDVIQASLQLTRHEVHDVSVIDEVPEGLHVRASRNHVVQVLVNLITNAAKAVRAVAEERTGEVRLQARRNEDGTIRVSVHDTGMGIEPELQERVFDPFYTTRDVGEGMGMGLSVCQTIIRNHGGELAVDSEPGAWTEFHFDLAAAEESAEPLSAGGGDSA